jgi:hypothetical protein
MRFRLRTLLIIVCLLAIALAITVNWVRRPVTARTMDGHKFDLHGRDALLHCVMTNDSKSLSRLLLIDKYDLDRCGGGGGNWTLLQQAVQHGYIETTTALLENGANPNVTYETVPTPLQMAERSGYPKLLGVLKEFGAIQ